MVQIKCIEGGMREGVEQKKGSMSNVWKQLRRNEYLQNGRILRFSRIQVRCQEIMQGEH